MLWILQLFNGCDLPTVIGLVGAMGRDQISKSCGSCSQQLARHSHLLRVKPSVEQDPLVPKRRPAWPAAACGGDQHSARLLMYGHEHGWCFPEASPKHQRGGLQRRPACGARTQPSWDQPTHATRIGRPTRLGSADPRDSDRPTHATRIGRT